MFSQYTTECLGYFCNHMIHVYSSCVVNHYYNIGFLELDYILLLQTINQTREFNFICAYIIIFNHKWAYEQQDSQTP